MKIFSCLKVEKNDSIGISKVTYHMFLYTTVYVY
jgi:hypothetical protein